MAFCAIPTRIGEGMDVVVEGGCAEVVGELLPFESRECRLEDSVGEFQLVGDTATGRFATVEEEPHDQFLDDLAIETSGFDRLGLDREDRFVVVLRDLQKRVHRRPFRRRGGRLRLMGGGRLAFKGGSGGGGSQKRGCDRKVRRRA